MIRAVLVLSVMTWPVASRGQPAGAQAEILFRQGRELMVAGKFAEACGTFEESERLEAAVTTLLNLAGCREKLGQLATAWGLFLAAERQTRSVPGAVTQQLHEVAQEHAQKLEPRVSRLTISVPQKSQLDGLEITRGKDRVDSVMWNRALPLDGGTYTVTARAPGSSGWSTQILIGAEGDTKTVEIPDLRNSRPPAPVRPAAALAPKIPPAAPVAIPSKAAMPPAAELHTQPSVLRADAQRRDMPSSVAPTKPANAALSPSIASRGDEPAGALASTEPASIRAPAQEQRVDLMSWTLARISAGASVAQRRLSYDMRSGFAESLPPNLLPPQVKTTAGGARIEGEIYPLALANVSGWLRGLGLAVAYDTTLDHKLEPRSHAFTAPTEQVHYDIGLRYQMDVLGAATVAFGLGYARRRYLIDQSSLSQPLDIPDVNYLAITPAVAVRVPLDVTITIFAIVDDMLILDIGPIQEPSHYGKSTVYGIEASGGVEIALAPWLVARVAFEYSRIAISFKEYNAVTAGRDGVTATQDITGATDRSIGGGVTIGLRY